MCPIPHVEMDALVVSSMFVCWQLPMAFQTFRVLGQRRLRAMA